MKGSQVEQMSECPTKADSRVNIKCHQITGAGSMWCAFIETCDTVNAPHVLHSQRLQNDLQVRNHKNLSFPLKGVRVVVSWKASHLSVRLISVEKLVMPRTCLEFNALSSLPSIRVLAVDCGDADKACVEELRAVLASLPKPLLQLRLESLERRLSASILETVTSRGLASRLVFRKCALPDSAMSHICQQSVPSGGGATGGFLVLVKTASQRRCP